MENDPVVLFQVLANLEIGTQDGVKKLVPNTFYSVPKSDYDRIAAAAGRLVVNLTGKKSVEAVKLAFGS